MRRLKKATGLRLQTKRSRAKHCAASPHESAWGLIKPPRASIRLLCGNLRRRNEFTTRCRLTSPNRDPQTLPNPNATTAHANNCGSLGRRPLARGGNRNRRGATRSRGEAPVPASPRRGCRRARFRTHPRDRMASATWGRPTRFLPRLSKPSRPHRQLMRAMRAVCRGQRPRDLLR